MKIVIADDSALLRERVRSVVISIKNVEIVGEAKNGIAALQLVKDKDPDLIILDIRMPELNGIEALEKIKGSGSRTKVCILTNYPYPQYKTRCLAEGADYFLDKNQDFDQIRIVVGELAQRNGG